MTLKSLKPELDARHSLTCRRDALSITDGSTYFPEQLETSSIETRAEGVNQTYPVPGHKESIVRPLLDNLSIDFENKTLYDFVAFGQRGWKNSRGRDAALWVADLVKSVCHDGRRAR